jgi:hypothetical protein
VVIGGDKETWGRVRIVLPLQLRQTLFTWKISWAPCETLPDPVKQNVKGPMDLGNMPIAISKPASRTAWRAIPELR